MDSSEIPEFTGLFWSGRELPIEIFKYLKEEGYSIRNIKWVFMFPKRYFNELDFLNDNLFSPRNKEVNFKEHKMIIVMNEEE